MECQASGIENTINFISLVRSVSHGSDSDHGNHECAIDAEQFAILVNTVMDNYLKAHQDENVVNGEKGIAEQVNAVLEEYKKAFHHPLFNARMIRPCEPSNQNRKKNGLAEIRNAINTPNSGKVCAAVRICQTQSGMGRKGRLY